MYKFEAYIDSIIGNLKISKKKKEELTEEFKDHLESLKLEFIEKGLPEGEAIKSAIERFGESSDIKKKLHNSLSGFGNLGSVLFGVVIMLIILIFAGLPVAGTIVAFGDYKSTIFVSPLFHGNEWFLMSSVLFFIPLGYFIPIIFKRVYKVVQLALTFSILGILIGACISISVINTVNIGFLLTYSAEVLLGGMAGYVILIAVNRLNMLHRSGVMKGYDV